MSDSTSGGSQGSLAGINSSRLFLGSCMSLVSTSVAFGAVTSLMGDLKTQFALTNTEAGLIGGATIWGFTISIFIFGPLCDIIGMRRLMRFSFLCHLIGPLIMIFASGFGMLFLGGLIISLANGTVEAVCNPLVATVYPDQKTTKLNQFHVWFPGGIVIGGLAAFGLDQMGRDFWEGMFLAAWQAKIALILIPTVLYGIIFTAQKFPATERVQSGISFEGMVKATLMRPLFIVLFFCMGLTASIELGPNRWMGDVMSGVMSKIVTENAGILVLVYGSGLMAILRFFAGPVVHRLSPTGLLLFSAVLSGAGLFALTHVEGPWLIFVCATIFYVGICYFWPTMLGVASERVPRGGALALGLLGGWGMAVVGLVTVPLMGLITDTYGHEKLPAVETKACIVQGAEELEDARKASIEAADEDMAAKIAEALELVNGVIAQTDANNGALPARDTAKALRSIAKFSADGEAGKQAGELIKPADEYGGPFSFRWVSALAAVLVVIFGLLYLGDRARGGYKAEKLTT